jgi:hypothetical protein
VKRCLLPRGHVTLSQPLSDDKNAPCGLRRHRMDGCSTGTTTKSPKETDPGDAELNARHYASDQDNVRASRNLSTESHAYVAFLEFFLIS